MRASDSGGGAGIQADLKTFSAFGVYGASVITALTAQNTVGVQGVHGAPPDFIAAQFDSVCSDLSVASAKIGMLATVEVIEVVAEKLQEHALARVVLDPVMVAKSGDRLLAPDAREALVEKLFPLAEVVTPNTEEARDILESGEIENLAQMKYAVRALHERGAKCVLLKGGHITDGAVDIFFDGEIEVALEGRRVDTPHTHGTGCTLSSAIAAGLALGETTIEAVKTGEGFHSRRHRERARHWKRQGPAQPHVPQARGKIAMSRVYSSDSGFHILPTMILRIRRSRYERQPQ